MMGWLQRRESGSVAGEEKKDENEPHTNSDTEESDTTKDASGVAGTAEEDCPTVVDSSLDANIECGEENSEKHPDQLSFHAQTNDSMEELDVIPIEPQDSDEGAEEDTFCTWESGDGEDEDKRNRKPRKRSGNPLMFLNMGGGRRGSREELIEEMKEMEEKHTQEVEYLRMKLEQREEAIKTLENALSIQNEKIRALIKEQEYQEKREEIRVRKAAFESFEKALSFQEDAMKKMKDELLQIDECHQ